MVEITVNELNRPGALAHVASPLSHWVVVLGALGAKPCADVETLLVVTSTTFKSESAGCDVIGWPLVEIALIHWCVTDVWDLTPPNVVDVGVGN